MAFSCGIVHMHPDGEVAKAGWWWPLSRVDVRESGVHAHTPVLFGKWTLDVPYIEIDEAVVRRQRWSGKVVLRRTDGEVTVSTMGANCARIGKLLSENGVRVTVEQAV